MLALANHPASLSNVNVRIQRHGGERVLAADMKLEVNVAGVVLNDLENGLQESLFRMPSAQGEQPDLIDPALLTAAKFPQLTISLAHKFPGYEISIGRDPEEEEPSFFSDATIKSISAKALEGGTATLWLTASVQIDPEDARDITERLVSEDVYLSLTPPKAKAQVDGLFPGGAPRNEDGERCENDMADCGPVAQHDTEGVPLCQRCWDELPALDDEDPEDPEAANDADGAQSDAA